MAVILDFWKFNFIDYQMILLIANGKVIIPNRLQHFGVDSFDSYDL